MLIDTHAHLWFPDFKHDLEEVLARARSAGVEKIIVPGTDIKSSKQSVELAKKYPGVIYAAVGIHPEEVLEREFLNHTYEETPPTFGVPTRPLAGSPVEESPLGLRELSTLKSDLLAAREQVVAIGEIGTDASAEELRSRMAEQQELFRAQCEIALEHDLPVIIHTRNSLDETLEVLDALPKMPRGQFHCFSHDEAGLTEVLTRGFYVSFAGNITWSKRVAKLVPLVPDDRLLLETDSPLMVPRDIKGLPLGQGERNEPGNVSIMAEKLAQLRGQSTEKVAEMTTVNAIRLFRL